MLDRLIDYCSLHPELATIALAMILASAAALGARLGGGSGLAPSIRDLVESILDEAADHRWGGAKGVGIPPPR
jgi:hypothetical protein